MNISLDTRGNAKVQLYNTIRLSEGIYFIQMPSKEKEKKEKNKIEQGKLVKKL